MSRKQLLILLSALVVVVIAAGGYYFYSSSDSASVTATSGQGYTLVPSDRTLGNPKAKVVMIEYAAPSCPVCAAFNHDSFALLKANYIDTGKIFYVLRIFPLRPDDGAAEKIARCLPEDKYFSFIDLLFRNQPLWDVEFGVLDVHGGLVRLGRIAGMSADEVDKCIDNKTEDDRINKVASDGESRYNITGTPTFVIDGAPQPAGNIPFADMKKLLDTELAKKQ